MALLYVAGVVVVVAGVGVVVLALTLRPRNTAAQEISGILLSRY